MSRIAGNVLVSGPLLLGGIELRLCGLNINNYIKYMASSDVLCRFLLSCMKQMNELC